MEHKNETVNDIHTGNHSALALNMPHLIELSDDRVMKHTSSKVSCSVGCQTDILEVHNEVGFHYFLCNLQSENGYNTASVQVNLQFNEKKQEFLQSEKKDTREVACGASGADAPKCRGFHGYSSVTTEEEVHDLCGVTLSTFQFLLNRSPAMREVKLSNKNKLLLFLMKLKLGLSSTALAVLFNIHRTSVSRIFDTILSSLAESLAEYIFWPSRELVQYNVPDSFKEHYKDCRVIIDCTEFRIETPPTLEQRNLCWSEYKHAHTFKVLIGITPYGLICFKSKCYGGRSSDSAITIDCGFLDHLEPNDLVLADKGFPHIVTNVGNKKGILVMPPFLRKKQFSVDEVNETYNIASVRIHVERCIQRMRLFYILRFVPTELFSQIDDILTVICALVNLGPPIINLKNDYLKK